MQNFETHIENLIVNSINVETQIENPVILVRKMLKPKQGTYRRS